MKVVINILECGTINKLYNIAQFLLNLPKNKLLHHK